MYIARNIQLLIVAFSSFLMGVLANKFLFSEQVITRPQAILSAVSNPVLEKTSADAIRQIQQLKQQLAQYQSYSSPASTRSQVSLSNAQTAAESEKNLRLAESKLAGLQAENYMKWIKDHSKSGNFNMGNEMQARFNVEAVDSIWAPVQEKKLADLFVDKSELSGFALKETKCRATQCQISIGITNLEQANFIVEKFSKLAAENNFMSVIAVPDVSAGNTTLYLSSAAQGFEFN